MATDSESNPAVKCVARASYHAPMGTFDELYASLNPNAQKRGFDFEHVCKWFLHNDPGYASRLKRVWLWKEWPDRWGDADSGIDLVVEDTDGRLWAVQAKAYGEDKPIPKHELNKWLAESSRAEFSCRLLITTSAAGFHYKAANTLAAQEKPVLVLDRQILRSSPVDWPATLEDFRPSPGDQDGGEPRNLPLNTTEEFVEALRVRNHPDPRFERWMALLEGFVEAHGHARVPADYSVGGQRLGRWVIHQRQRWARGKLSPDKVARLERLPGWVFDCYESAWLENYRQLAVFVSTHGSPSVPVDFEGDNGICLAAWIVNQRTRYAAGKLAPHRVRLLEAVPGWTWDRSGTSNAAGAERSGGGPVGGPGPAATCGRHQGVTT
jgi:hypothetical protein